MLIVDCNVEPSVPEGLGLKLKNHEKGGIVVWDPRNFRLYASKMRADKKPIRGHDVKKQLEDLKGMKKVNACMLDFFLANPVVIPETWKGKYGNYRFIYFWGTEYLNAKGSICIRCMFFGPGNRWNDGCIDLEMIFKENDFALMLKAA